MSIPKVQRKQYLQKVEQAISAVRLAQDLLTDVNLSLVVMAQSSMHATMQCLLQAEESLGGKR